MDQLKFQEACAEVVDKERERHGIGTLGEKTLHAVLKRYFESREEYQEIRLGGYVADISNEDGVIEIQTRNFNALRKKLKVFLESGKVMIVYPIPYIKWLRWIQEQTGETTDRRKSPKKGAPYQAFYELYKIKEFLLHPNLSICIVLLNVEEYRLLNGWSEDKKRGSTRYDRIPLEIVDEIYIQNVKGYDIMLPDTLDKNFTSKDYKKCTKLTISQAQTALHVLHYVGAIKRVGKQGRAYVYEKE